MKKASLIVAAEELVTCSPGGGIRRLGAMSDIGLVHNGAVAVIDGIIDAVGEESEILSSYETEQLVRAKSAVPALVDAHTHPLFAGSRINEYEMRANGSSYLDIMNMGGGIAGTVRNTRNASSEELLKLLLERLDRMLKCGTGTIEAKSGYGLSLDEELRELRIIKQASLIHPMDIVPTLLGAHAVPKEYAYSLRDRRKYIDIVKNEMIPAAAEEGLAEFADVFCEEGAFSISETEEIMDAAMARGLKTRIHSEQFKSSGASLRAAAKGACSCDHLLGLSVEDIRKIRDYDTVCMFLPSSEFFLNVRNYGKMREAIDEGAAVGLATDFNAGSCLSESLPMTMSIAVIQMRIKPEEAILASTVNPACSIGRGDSAGSIERGRQADIICLGCGYREWLYHFGVNMITDVIKKGKVYV